MRTITNRIKSLLLTFIPITSVLITGAFVYGVGSTSVYAATPADNKTAVCEGIGLTGSGCGATGGPSVDSTVKLAIGILSFIVGIAAVIMVMVGGFKYITSSGDSNNINSAKDTILYAIIGLVIAVLAQIIVRFVLNQAAPTAGTPAGP